MVPFCEGTSSSGLKGSLQRAKCTIQALETITKLTFGDDQWGCAMHLWRPQKTNQPFGIEGSPVFGSMRSKQPKAPTQRACFTKSYLLTRRSSSSIITG